MQHPASGLLAIGLIFSMCTACSLFAPSRQTFTVTASEPDAKIYVNGEFIGQGNVQTQVKRNRNVAVLVRKEGYYPTQRSIDKTISALGITDILGGSVWIIPFIGMLSPGAWDLQEQNITIMLEPIQANQTASQLSNE